MKITADTNLLLRTVLQDDPPRSREADALLAQAAAIAVPPTVFCEFAWVSRRGYGYSNDEIAHGITAICNVEAVATDGAAVDLGLAMLRAGGDFADGVIAHQGRTLGGGAFASFDRAAVTMLKGGGVEAEEPVDLLVD
ncbi:MAG: type II toxin-antitoxin system VapC family toxin [Gammaproteobacteria bacterium]|nr:type II toxin-antitoxin system VapC family toxin [Gammaproteobacteria bacterium]